MKLLFDSLDALLAELRERNVEVVRVSRVTELEQGPRTAGMPQFVSRVLVTVALDERSWAEWRHWVGQAVPEIDGGRPRLPAWLREKQDFALAEISRRLDEAGLRIREGILTHDRGVMDSFRL
jgi:hypothetical protein